MSAVASAAYQIPDGRVPELRGKVTRLARRARKLGMAAVELREVHAAPRLLTRWNPATRKPVTYELPCTWCELVGPAPVVAGHTFIARVEHSDVGNIVARADHGDETDLTAYRSAKAVCDHCKSTRRRNDTFVLRGPDGALRQIGRNCLADYLRSACADVVIDIMHMVEQLSRETGADEPNEFGGGGGGWSRVTKPDEFVAAAVAAERLHGWKSSKQEGSTAGIASFLCGPCPLDPEAAAGWRADQPTEADVARAATILAWVIASTDSSDYMHNLRVAAQKPVTHRTSGVLASAVIAYARHVVGVERASREAAERPVSTYCGEVGKRYEISATVTFVRHVEGGWGVTTIVGLVDAEGRRLKWFASGSKDFEIGAAVALKGTVKKHEEYKGARETVLSRCVVL